MKARLASPKHSGRRMNTRGFTATLAWLCVLVLIAVMARAPFSSAQTSESISTFGSDCATPQTLFNLGDTVCAETANALIADPDVGSGVQRRFEWVTPDGSLFQPIGPDIITATQSTSITIPATGSNAQVGTWTVKTVDSSNNGHAVARFVVQDPANDAVDLWCPISAPFEVSPGSSAPFTVFVTNKGPNDAQNVRLTVTVATSSTFQFETQVTGPAFSCSNPDVGSASGSSTCTIASLPANTSAQFSFVFQVDSGASGGTGISSTATVSSDTNELFDTDNSFTASVTVSQTTCDLSCPGNMTVNSDPGQCGAVVNFTTPTGSGSNCGTIACSPPAGSVFPLGTTNVVCSGDSGGPCAFTVTVRDSQAASITCPANITVSESSPDIGSAVVNYPAPTLNDNCPLPNAACNPPSGSSFPVGTTTVTCQTTNNQGDPLTCSFTVTVTGTGGGNCTITCPSDITQSATSGLCTAVVNYSSPTTSGSCGAVTCSPPSGSTFTAGTTTVACTVNGGPSCEFLVTVVPASVPVITTCAANKTVSANVDCEGAIPNLVGEVVATGCNVVISQSPAAGSIVSAGSYTVTITAENAAGETTCTATVNVVDVTPPVITSPCPSGTSASAGSSCQAAVPNVTGGVTASDNCTPAGSLTVTQNPAAGTLVGLGTTTITITVKDAANNSATCTTTFTVNDTTPPVAVCKNITVALDANGNASITAADVDNGSSDNCGIASRTVSPATFNCANKGPNTVTLTVRDGSNNTSSCNATVTVIDNIPPAITCQADINVDFDPGVGGAIVTYVTPVGADNCPGAVTTQIAGLPSGATFPVGNTTNTFRVTDASGLTAQCSFRVTVALTSLIGLDSVSITGSGLVDSYDSSGGYPATKGSLTNILSNGTITLGNSGKVFGNVRSTRAGVSLSGASQVTGNATAGTTVSTSGSATVGGTVTNNQLAPVMTLPSVPACGPPYSPNSGISGTYTYNPSTGDLSLTGVNIATLANGTYCFHNVTLTNSAQLKVNGPVVINITGTLNAGGATSLTNTTSVPANLRILSSYTGANGVTLSNATSAYLVVYAPNTAVTITGAAPLFGTVAGKTLTISNSGMVHYDTLLKSIWPDLWFLIQGH